MNKVLFLPNIYEIGYGKGLLGNKNLSFQECQENPI